MRDDVKDIIGTYSSIFICVVDDESKFAFIGVAFWCEAVNSLAVVVKAAYGSEVEGFDDSIDECIWITAS